MTGSHFPTKKLPGLFCSTKPASQGADFLVFFKKQLVVSTASLVFLFGVFQFLCQEVGFLQTLSGDVLFFHANG